MADRDTCELLCLDLEKAEALRQSRPDPRVVDAAAAAAQALGDPTRLSLAMALGAGAELCVCDLAWVSERSEKLVSHHMRVLREAGCVRSRRDGKMVMYALTPSGRELLDSVIAAARPEVAPV